MAALFHNEQVRRRRKRERRTWRTISMVTKPAEGIAAAPTAAKVAVKATTIVPAKPRDTP